MTTTPSSATGRRMILWLGAGAAAVLALSVAGTVAPIVFKRLVLFHVAFGIVCGGVLAWLSREIRPFPGRWQLVAAGLLTLGAGMNMGWQSFRNFESVRRSLAAREPDQVAAIQMLEKMNSSDPDLQQAYTSHRKSYVPEFSDYLAHRVRGVGEWPAPWPLLFWLGELGLSAGAAAVTMKKLGSGPGAPGATAWP